MRCKGCGSFNSSVVDTRIDSNRGRVRRRSCNDCGARYNTVETPLEEFGGITISNQRYEELIRREELIFEFANMAAKEAEPVERPGLVESLRSFWNAKTAKSSSSG